MPVTPVERVRQGLQSAVLDGRGIHLLARRRSRLCHPPASGRSRTAGAKAAMNAGADFVKTSTGFGPGAAKVEEVVRLRSVVGANLGVNASAASARLPFSSGWLRPVPSALALVPARKSWPNLAPASRTVGIVSLPWAGPQLAAAASRPFPFLCKFHTWRRAWPRCGCTTSYNDCLIGGRPAFCRFPRCRDDG
jgi:hypothetical protein